MAGQLLQRINIRRYINNLPVDVQKMTKGQKTAHDEFAEQLSKTLRAYLETQIFDYHWRAQVCVKKMQIFEAAMGMQQQSTQPEVAAAITAQRNKLSDHANHFINGASSLTYAMLQQRFPPQSLSHALHDLQSELKREKDGKITQIILTGINIVNGLVMETTDSRNDPATFVFDFKSTDPKKVAAHYLNELMADNI